MQFKIQTRSLVIGICLGIAAALVAGAASGGKDVGQYQLSMAANETYVFFGRMDTTTGAIETWKRSSGRLPHEYEDRILLKLDSKSPND